MRPVWLLVLLLCACGVVKGANAPRDGGPAQEASTCAVDGDCEVGMVCEGCGDGSPTQCVPGCRTADQCPGSLTCLLGVTCVTCPCPPGWCDLDPCRDVDGDGYVATSDPQVSCPGKRKGDCDDSRPWVNPGQPERCSNGLDDDCNGKTDASDTAACQTCSGAQQWCTNTITCDASSFCDRGCCAACPLVSPPACGAGRCLLPARAANDCDAAGTCVTCPACTTQTPVCGVDLLTYATSCLAQGVGVEVLHQGECLPREGASCQGTQERCTQDLVCAQSVGRCMANESCNDAADCRAAPSASVPCDDAGFPTSFSCEAHRCVPHC
jgi:hypothetical protein